MEDNVPPTTTDIKMYKHASKALFSRVQDESKDPLWSNFDSNPSRTFSCPQTQWQAISESTNDMLGSFIIL